jgi:glyoxylase-like metal-dependent hydrolase (beta-lactamase superfamily II)
MVDVSEVAKNIYMIDNRLFSIPRWGSVYLINETKKALVESGPTTSVAVVLDGIRELGVRPEDIAYIIVTHVHLDHAGGAGVLARHMPQAQVVVHHKGARHLTNPARLVASATEARGSEVMMIHGEVLPIELHHVQAVNEGDTISLSRQQTLRFIDAPGHAPHELCIYETRNGGLFTGDAVAVYIAEYDILLPFHPPPQFNLELCLSTLQRLEKFSAHKIYYSHFGASDQVSEHIDRARKKLMVWDGIVKKAAKEGTFADLKARLIDQAYADLELMKGVASLASLYDYLVKIHIPMCADGHIEYYRKALKLS